MEIKQLISSLNKKLDEKDGVEYLKLLIHEPNAVSNEWKEIFELIKLQCVNAKLNELIGRDHDSIENANKIIRIISDKDEITSLELKCYIEEILAKTIVRSYFEKYHDSMVQKKFIMDILDRYTIQKDDSFLEKKSDYKFAYENVFKFEVEHIASLLEVIMQKSEVAAQCKFYLQNYFLLSDELASELSEEIMKRKKVTI